MLKSLTLVGWLACLVSLSQSAEASNCFIWSTKSVFTQMNEWRLGLCPITHEGLQKDALSMWDVWRLMRHLSLSLTHSVSHTLNGWAWPSCSHVFPRRLSPCFGHLKITFSDPIRWPPLPQRSPVSVSPSGFYRHSYTNSTVLRARGQPFALWMVTGLAYRVLYYYIWMYGLDQGGVCESDWTTVNVRGLNPL